MSPEQRTGLAIVLMLLLALCTLYTVDHITSLKMADKGFCYTPVDRVNTSSETTWLKCKVEVK